MRRLACSAVASVARCGAAKQERSGGTAMAESRPRLVIVDPAYASTVGHHGEVNGPLLAELGRAELGRADWAVELWADVALEGELAGDLMGELAGVEPQGVRGVFSGCGYEDPRHWRELGGMVQLARRLEQQLALASATGNPQGEEPEPVAAWLAHSLLPFQLLGLARHLSRAPRAQVVISLMFAPAERLEGGSAPAGGPALEGGRAGEQASANCRVALAALARAVALQGHRLTLAFPSRQQEQLYAPLLQATGLASAGVHPAVVGAGCRPRPSQEPGLVLLHWGDLKAGKGRELALAVLQTLLEAADSGQPQATAALGPGWGWLFQQHSREALPAEERALLERAEAAGLGLVWLQGEVESQTMHDWLARCPVALLAYDPAIYGQRSSGMLWQWAASRTALGLPAAAVGHASGWLASEARELGLSWITPAIGQGGDGPAARSGPAWLAALAAAAQSLPAQARLTEQGRQVLGSSFAAWCVERLSAASG